MKIDSFITQLCEHCGIEAEDITISLDASDSEITVTLAVPQEDSGIFIGHHGEGVDAIQRIVRIIFQDRENPEADKKITVNINGYREKREERLKDLTFAIGNKVLDTKQPYTFSSYLPAYERFIIHSTLSEEEGFSELESVSEGTGKTRKLTIKIKE